MEGVNKVIVLGTLGKDPELRVFQGQNGAEDTKIASFTMATSESWTDKATNERKQVTEWHNVEFRNKQAEIIAQYVKKGHSLYVEGKLKTQEYTDKEGLKRKIVKVIGNSFSLLPNNKSSEGAQVTEGQAQQNVQGYKAQPAVSVQGAPVQSGPAPVAQTQSAPVQNYSSADFNSAPSDDLPF